jgi:hypothetical protein
LHCTRIRTPNACANLSNNKSEISQLKLQVALHRYLYR